MNIKDLSCINNTYKKYNPKSSALKKLIEKLKKEDEYEESRNNHNNHNLNKSNNISNNNSIQISSFGDSELFTLGNSNINENNKINKQKRKNKKEHNKLRYKSELNSNQLRNKKIRTFDKITESKYKYNKMNSDIDLIRDRIKKISNNIYTHGNLNIKIKSLSKKNHSMKSLYNSTNYKNNKKYYFSPVLSLENISYIKNKKHKSKSMNMKIHLTKEEKDYIIKYEELKVKFEEQREKMKKEKDNLIIIQQKIKFFKKKFEKYSDLVQFNKTLNEQNYILLNNLSFSDEVRKKQAKLIEFLRNQIKKIKKYN